MIVNTKDIVNNTSTCCAKIISDSHTSYDTWSDISDIKPIKFKEPIKELNIHFSENAYNLLKIEATDSNKDSNIEICVCTSSEYSFYSKKFSLLICICESNNSIESIYTSGNNLFGGCNKCITRHTEIIKQIYQDNEFLVEIDCLAFIYKVSLLYYEGYNICFHLTSLYEQKPLSTFFPFSNCDSCREKSILINDLKVPEFLLFNGNHNQNSDNKTGYRQVDPEVFCNNNYYFVGHSSIIKPISGGEYLGGVFLYGAAISVTTESSTLLNIEFSGGKGLDEDQALAGAIAEGLERYFLSGIFSKKSQVYSEDEISYNYISPSSFFGWPFSTEVFKYSDIFIGDDKKYNISKTFSSHTKSTLIEWTHGYSLTQNKDVLIPTNCIYCPFLSDHNLSTYSGTSTNGVAVGTSLNEAIIQGFFELVERDAFWYYSRINAPVYEIPKEYFQPLNIPKDIKHVFMLLPSDFKLPVVQCILETKNGKNIFHARGTGASFDIRKPINRTYSEAYQMHQSLSSTREIDDPNQSGIDMRGIWSHGLAKKHFPNFFSPKSIKSLSNIYLNESIDSVDDAYKKCIKICKEHNIELAYHNYVGIEKSFYVVRVFMENISCFDSLYYKNNDRLNFLSKSNNTECDITYKKSLFM